MMKRGLVFVAAGIVATAAHAAFKFGAFGAFSAPTPQSPVVTYGLVRDAVGSPLTLKSEVALRLVKDADREGQVYAQCDVGDSGIPGMNYRLSLEIDSAGPVRTRAVLEKTAMRILATAEGEDATLSPEPVFVTPVQGTKQRRDFFIGEDSDGDGMPDDWELWRLLRDRINKGLPLDLTEADLRAFRPGDDADGDGMSNLQEFLAGTNPFDATSLFAITAFSKLDNIDRVAVTFSTTSGREYHLLMTASLEEPNWTPVATSDRAAGELVYQTYKGDGGERTVYAESGLDHMFFRVASE